MINALKNAILTWLWPVLEPNIRMVAKGVTASNRDEMKVWQATMIEQQDFMRKSHQDNAEQLELMRRNTAAYEKIANLLESRQ